jgi:hypothetical protein
MDKISFCPVDGEEAVGFFVVEETRIGGVSYLLVTESEQDDAEAYILKDLSEDGDPDAKYAFVEDDDELEAVSKVFAELLEGDVDLEL